MPWDDDADDDHGLGPPLPPEDRLWRHPSEVAGETATRAAASSTRAREAGRPATWSVAVTAGLTGAALAVGVIALTGSLSPRVVERAVVEKVALAPVVSSPMLQGASGVDELAEHIGPAIAHLDVDRDDDPTTGSAVVFRDDGLLLTSATLVVGARTITVVLADGRHFDGELVGLDAATDVAVVRIGADRLRVAVLGTAEDLAVGDPTVAVGAPLGLAGGPSVSTGVITAIKRQVDTVHGLTLHGMLQTDAPITPTGVGGALVDSSGAVIGITSAAGTDGDRGYGFATPIDLVHRVAIDIVDTGRATHGWLGIEGADLTAAEAASAGVADGALVRGVAGNSPAATAGLAAGDVITEVDGQAVASMSSLVLELRERRPGDQIVVGYWRAGLHHETTVTIGSR